ncbi:MAG: hypothetical protein ACLQCB_11370 [Spirochaetia bacterium]
MGRVIFSAVLLVLLTVLIVMNLGPTTPVNLFGAKFANIPVVAVAMLSFVLGVVYSLFLYVGQYIHRSSRERLAQRHRDVEERERKLAVAQEQADQAAETPPPEPPQDAPDGSGQRRESALARFFKLFR